MSLQYSFAEMELKATRSKKTRIQQQLDKIEALVDGNEVEQWLRVTDPTGKQRGRPPIAVLVKAKMLFLQYIHNLSDPE